MVPKIKNEINIPEIFINVTISTFSEEFEVNEDDNNSVPSLIVIIIIVIISKIII